MKSVKPWISGLGVNEASAEAWMRDLPKNESFTFWCLATGKIGTEKYLAWAREHYGLAVLQPDFFQQPPNLKIWQAIQSVANWSEQMIPLVEWDGVVFIACAEPFTDVQWSFPVRYVLASPYYLKAYWKALQTPDKFSPPPAPLGTAAQASLNSIPTATPAVTAIPVVENSQPPAAATSPVPFPQKPAVTIESIVAPLPTTDTSAAVANDEPEGLRLDLSQIKVSTGSGDMMDQLQKSIGAPAEAKVDLNVPENLSWKNSDGLDTNVLNFKAPEGLGPSIAEAVTPPPVTSASTDTPSEILVFKPKTPEGPPAMAGAARSDSELTMSGADYIGVLLQLKNHFLGGMVLWVNNEQIKPLSWDEAFRPKDASAEKFVSLNSPSAFRIAYRTKMPYLGHIVETPTNREFFQAWGFADLPKSVLIQPVKAEGKVVYLLLAIVDTSRKNHHVLSAGEKLAQMLATMKYQPKAA